MGAALWRLAGRRIGAVAWPLQRTAGMQGTANATSQRKAVPALGFAVVITWCSAAAAEAPAKQHDPRGNPNGMALGGLTAVVLSLPPLITGLELYQDNSGFVSGRAFSPFFLVPGGVSFTAGVTLLAVGLARGSDETGAPPKRAFHLVVAPQQVAVGGAF